MNTERE